MLESLTILNGELELDFNEYIYEYTVSVPNDVDHLEFSWILKDGSYISIRNNNIIGDESIVYIDVSDLNKTDTYTFYVYKENTNLTTGIENYKKSLEITKEEKINILEVQILSICLFITIIILYSIIFKRKKRV